MKPVFQEIISHGNGDCLRACMASILELEISQVPNFRSIAQDGCSVNVVNEWLASKGLAYLSTSFVDGDNQTNWWGLNSVYCIFSVDSQMFQGASHAVVGYMWKEGETFLWRIVHDPNPNNTPYPTDVPIKRIGLFVQRFN